MPKMYEISVPYTGRNWIEVIAETEEEAIEAANEQASDDSPDMDNAEFDYSDTEIESERDLTADELKQWQAEQGASTEGPKP